MMEKTAIVLPCYIPDQEVLNCYQRFMSTLWRWTPRDTYKLFTIDNGSKLGSEEMEDDADTYLAFDHPIGYARAVNVGMSYALIDGFERIVVANNDIEFTEPWLQTLNNFYNETGGLLSPQDDERWRGDLYPDESWYALWMIDRTTWEKVGKLDDSYLNYRFHDQDYSIRLKKAGFFVGRTGAVQVKHQESTTYKKMGRNEDPAEREVMLKRHGYAHFKEWVAAQPIRLRSGQGKTL